MIRMSVMVPMSPITLIVVDDHPIFRQGVVDALSLDEGLQVIGQTANGEEALAMIRTLKPVVAVVDVNLPGLNGQQVVRQVTAERLPTRVVLLTAYDDAEQRLHAMRGGAFAYCSKDVQPDELIRIIRQVMAGWFVVGERVMAAGELERWLSQSTEGALRSYGDPGEPYHPLSEREMEVLRYIAKGMSNKEIAALLGISHQTVKNHVTAILRKLGVGDRTQAVIYAIQRGWVRLHEQITEQE